MQLISAIKIIYRVSLSNLSLELYERLNQNRICKSDEEFRSVTKFFFERLPKFVLTNLALEKNFGISKLMFGIVYLLKIFCLVIGILNEVG